MKTKLAPTLLVICFSLLLSACNKPANSDLTKAENKEEAKNENFSQKSTLKSLLGLGKNLTCTYEFADSDNKVETKGTTYISGKNFATDIEVSSDSDQIKKVTSHMISDGEYIYTWSDDQKGSGMKMKIETPDPNTKEVKTDVASAQENMEKEYDMKCSPWGVDQSKFTLPVDIKFTDLSEMMKNLPQITNIPMPKIKP